MGSSPRVDRAAARALVLTGLVLSGLFLGNQAWAQEGGPPPAPPLATEASQVLGFQVAVSIGVALSSVWVEAERLGEQSVITLADDGSVPEDLPWDGIYVGSQPGPYARYSGVRLFGRDAAGVDTLLWEGTVRTEDAWRPTLGFRVSWQGDHLRAERVALALPTGPGAIAEGLPVIVAFGWGLFVLVAVGLIVRRAPGEVDG